MVDDLVMKGKGIVMPFALHKQILDQLHSSNMGIEQTWLLVRESVYLINMNVGIECTVKQCATWLKYKQMQPQERTFHYEIPCRPWEEVDADIFMINGKILLCIVDYHSKFPIMEKVNSQDDFC